MPALEYGGDVIATGCLKFVLVVLLLALLALIKQRFAGYSCRYETNADAHRGWSACRWVRQSQRQPTTGPVENGLCGFLCRFGWKLRWQVARFDDRAQSFKNVFSEWDLLPVRVLRLAFAPGHYRIRVTFTNRVVREPGLVEVEVRDGMITPVHVVLIPEGASLVETREDRWGTSYKGHYRPRHQSQQL